MPTCVGDEALVSFRGGEAFAGDVVGAFFVSAADGGVGGCAYHYYFFGECEACG